MNQSDWVRFDAVRPYPYQLCVCAGSPDGNRIIYGIATWNGSQWIWIVKDEDMELGQPVPVSFWLPITKPPQMNRPDQKYVLINWEELDECGCGITNDQWVTMQLRIRTLEEEVSDLLRSAIDA